MLSTARFAIPPATAPAAGLERFVVGDADNITALSKQYKKLPMVSHSAAGTLYEEPCVIFLRVRLPQTVIMFSVSM